MMPKVVSVIGSRWINKAELGDVDHLDFRLEKNEEVVQKSNTSRMLWKIDELIAYLSTYFTLKIGDVIFTGTPAGVGPVAAEDQLTGFLQDKKMFSIKIK